MLINLAKMRAVVIMDTHTCPIIEIHIKRRQIQMFTTLAATVAKKFFHSSSPQQKHLNLILTIMSISLHDLPSGYHICDKHTNDYHS